MNRFIALIACTVVAIFSFAQKHPLDIKACQSWNRIDNAQLSPTGRYVTYQITPIDRGYDSKEKSATMLYDSKNKKKTHNLGYIDNLAFFNNDKQLYYTQNDSTGSTHTYIVDLSSWKKRTWEHAEALSPLKGTNYSAARLYIQEDSIKHIKSHSNLIIRDLVNEESTCIEGIHYYDFYNQGSKIIFVNEIANEREIAYGPIMGPYQVLAKGNKKSIPSSFSFDRTSLLGEFNLQDSLFCKFNLKDKSIDTIFCIKEIPIPKEMKIARINLMKNQNYMLLELADSSHLNVTHKKETREKDKSFELELWTWDELEVPTLQSAHPYQHTSYDKYIYNQTTRKLVKVVPAQGEISLPYRKMEETGYILYTDKTPYLKEKEWREKLPFDIYSVNINTGESKMIGKEYRDAPKWSPSGRWALIYNPRNKNWNKFDALTGNVINVSADIPYPVYDEEYDKPAPAPAYGIAGWTADGRYVFVMDCYDWWKVDLTGKEKTICLTRGVGRKNQIAYRMLYSNIDKDIFETDERVYVKGYHKKDMSQSICQIDMKGNIYELMHGDFAYNVNAFSDNRKFCLWTRQNTSTYPDLWISTSTFTNLQRVTDANPQQKKYLWGNVKIVEWKNYEGNSNRGLLYLPEKYDSKKTYPVIVQFYETHTEEKNNYCMPMLSSAMVNIMYAVSNGYIVFMPDVHFSIGIPGQSTYDAVVSGTNWLIEHGIAHKGSIGLQGHSWSGFQTTYLVTKTDLFDCAQIGAPITDMITGYLGIRNGSGLPRYFMYEETQSRMGSTLWEAKDKYRAMSPIIDADKIHTPLLIFHNDQDEAVAYEQGRALYLAMRRLQRPAWMVNYKGEGHFVLNNAAQKDWTIRMMQFFDYYLKHTKEPRWMKEGIQLKDRGYDQKYDLVK